MGITYLEAVVTGRNGKTATVRFLVDSGATYTLLPYDDWQALDLSPKRTVKFSLADGTMIQRQVSECHIALPQGDGHTSVILGESGDQAVADPDFVVLAQEDMGGELMVGYLKRGLVGKGERKPIGESWLWVLRPASGASAPY